MPSPTDQICLNDAVTYTTEWRDKNPGGVTSFIVAIDDLKGVVNELGADYARIYLGYGSDGLEKIMIVGADSSQQDMILDMEDPYSTDSGIYDFSNPCPPTCSDTTSPLATGIIPT